MVTSLYTRSGSGFKPGEHTRGGWDNDGQHGGPPCGLLAHAAETVATAVPMHTVRLTFDLHRMIPLHEVLDVEAEVVRDGRRIQVVETRLLANGVEHARATALKIRTTDLDLDAPPPSAWASPGPPEDARPVHWPDDGHSDRSLIRFHLDGVEIRTFDKSWETAGPGISWVRLRYPLLDDEPTSPLGAMATVADLGNGNSRVLDPRRWMFVNPDVTLALQRLPEGPWIGLDSISYPGTHGIGLADTLVFDAHGPCGRITQSQLLVGR